jgi:hypothetical protein
VLQAILVRGCEVRQFGIVIFLGGILKEHTVQSKSLAVPRRAMIFRLCLIPVFLLAVPAALCAQSAKDSWSNLNTLKSGQGIEVIETSMKRHGGQFVTFTDDVLSLQEKGSEVAIKREDIVRVSRASAPRRGEHAVIGLVVGGLIGAGVGALAGSRSTGFLGSEKGVGALVGIAIGAPSGALVGAVVPASTVVYRASPHKPAPKSP